MVWSMGLLGSMIIAGAAYWKKSLSVSGSITAIAVGTLLYALGSLAWFGTLIAFFVSSSLLSKFKQKRKVSVESGYAKTGKRDAGQVLANGGVGVMLCLLNAVWPNMLWWMGFVGVMASVNADTWATEIGGLSKASPRSIVTGKSVVPGTSGGLTWLGIAASFAGGLFIGGVAWICIQLGTSSIGEGEGSLSFLLVHDKELLDLFPLLIIGIFAGLAGSLSDSWLGAAWQIMHHCEVCGKEVEKNIHCNTPTFRIRGSWFVTNDTVNVISSLVGGTVAVLLSLLL